MPNLKLLHSSFVFGRPQHQQYAPNCLTQTYTWGCVCSVWESWSISSAVRAPSMERIWESFWGFTPNYTGSRMKDCCLILYNELSPADIRGCLVGSLCPAVPLPFSLTSLLWQCASAGLSMLTPLTCACFHSSLKNVLAEDNDLMSSVFGSSDTLYMPNAVGLLITWNRNVNVGSNP